MKAPLFQVVLLLGIACLLCLPAGTIPPVAPQSNDPAEVGQLGPLIPFHKDAIYAFLAWTEETSPKIYFSMRPAEYRGSDLVDPTSGPMGALKPAFERLVFGGFRFSRGPNGLDESLTTRIKADIPRDNALCFDLMHPDAFQNNGKFHVQDLNEEDFALNAGAFSDAGHSAGLNYNVFCSGNAALADGRVLFVGGHDKSGNNGIRKINIFDPATETWLPRPAPPVKADFLADPTGLLFPHADPLNELNTDPPLPSDTKYQRWYPTAVTLPDGRVLILSGSDQDSSAGPANAALTKVRQAVPEIYDPETDTTVALENARKLFAMYPRAYVVQTGSRENDWKVAVTAEIQPPLPTGAALRAYDPFNYNGRTYLLDVLGALADPNIDVPAENHWELVDTATYSHESGAGAALWTLDRQGRATSQKVVFFGGDSGTGTPVAAVEMIDFQASIPRWERQQDLIQPATQNNAVVLPDGKVVIMGGRSGRGTSLVNSFQYQMFDPQSGETKPLVETTVARHDHSTALLLPDATVITMGGNRTDLSGDPTEAGRNKGVPVAQVYYPSYLFKGARPVIKAAPTEISYGSSFRVRVSGEWESGQIESVVMIRMGPITHNWDWGNRFVSLAFARHRGRRLIVKAPAVPGLAVPGYYMLFVVSENGVPSVAKVVHLMQPEEEEDEADSE